MALADTGHAQTLAYAQRAQRCGNKHRFQSNDKTLASTGADASVRLWSIADQGQGQGQALLPGQGTPITSVAWNPKGNLLTTGADGDWTVRLL